jgi:uncharacterized protein (TIGR02001 family)
MTKIVRILIACSLLAVALPAAAQLSGKVSFTSQYTLRGIAQTKEDPAIQGSIDYAHSSGFYIGLWGSNVDFSLVGLDPRAQAEFDLYGGWAWTAKSGFGTDLGLVHYEYPDTDLSFNEIYLGISYKVFKLKYYYADNYLGFGNTEGYLDGSVDIPFGAGFTLTLHGGYSTFEQEIFLPDYYDYKAAVSRSFKNVTVEVAYIDSDEKLLGNQSDGRGVVTVSYSP